MYIKPAEYLMYSTHNYINPIVATFKNLFIINNYGVNPKI